MDQNKMKYCVTCDELDVVKLPGCPLQCRTPQCKAYQRRPPFDTEATPIVWVLGGPGCGKFALCKKIVENYGFTHLCTGDILRDEVTRGSDRAKCLNSVMERGGLVPNDLVLAALKDAMIVAADAGARGYIIDGYPRQKSQGVEFERSIGRVSLILFFEASMETLSSRLTTRVATSVRKDDNVDTIKLRLDTFLKYNPAVLKFYDDRVVKINAEQPMEAILAQVRQAMDPIVARAQAYAQNAEAAAIEQAKAAAEQAANTALTDERHFADDKVNSSRRRRPTATRRRLPSPRQPASGIARGTVQLPASPLVGGCRRRVGRQPSTSGDGNRVSFR